MLLLISYYAISYYGSAFHMIYTLYKCILSI